MAALDWSQCSTVESVPDRVGGAWVFRGTRLPVATVSIRSRRVNTFALVDQTGACWNRLVAWLRCIDGFQHAALARR